MNNLENLLLNWRRWMRADDLPDGAPVRACGGITNWNNMYPDSHMKKTQKKYELEALSSRGIRFITEEYIPQKLRGKRGDSWLD